MDKIFKFINLILIFLFLSIIKIENVNTLEPTIGEYNCLKNIVTKFKLNTQYTTNSSGLYPFCSFSTLVFCNSNGTIDNLHLTAESTTTATILYTDLTCFPYLTSLQLLSFTVSTTLLYNKLPTVNSLNLAGSKGITGITQQLALYTTYFGINSQDFNSILKLSYLNGLPYVSIGGGKLRYEMDAAANKTTLVTFGFRNALNIPDMTGYTKLGYDSISLVDGYDTASLANISKIPAISLTIEATSSFQYPTKIYNGTNALYFVVSAPIAKPSAVIDLSSYSGYTLIQISDKGTAFNVNGDLPIKVGPKTSIYFSGGAITKIPALTSTFLRLEIHSNISSVFPTTYVSANTPRFFDLSENKITGSVTSSWCSVGLDVSNNKMSGALPSCIYCYLNDSSVYNRFIGNSFTNLVTTPTCSTFSPKISISKTNITISGTDIGANPGSYWVFNSTLSGWYTNSYGSNYTCSLGFLSKVQYFWINFKQPGNLNYTFPAISKEPTPTSIIINSNRATITGTFFSSYLNYVGQTITVGSTACTIVSSTFYQIQCTMTSTPTNTQLVTITTNSLTKKVYIKTTNALVNNKACPSDCGGNSRGVCDLSTGICQCNTGYALDTCLGYQCSDPNCSNGGTCDLVIGVCKCDASHQGNICQTPFIQCPSNTAICSNAGTCNNQTGICTCNIGRTLADCSGYKCDTQNNCNGFGTCDTAVGKCQCDANHQGIDCSIPFIQCPIVNSKICNGFGSCNNQTGSCTCSINWQGKNCDTPYVPCLNDCIDSIHGSCDNQTGICSCGKDWQSKDCSVPFSECPSVNTDYCSSYGQCNNITGDCTCIDGRFGDDCSQIQCQVPDCSGFGQCDYSIGECSCNYPHFGDSCSLIQCIDKSCSGNGQCNTNKGICECLDGWSGQTCIEPICLTNCTNHGTCIFPGQCSCEEGRLFNDCSGFQCLDPACGNNGKCQTLTGTCECSIQYTGTNCTVANHYVSSITSTDENGGEVTIFGFFGDTHNNLTVNIGNQQCQVSNITNDFIICEIESGIGIKDVTISQNDITWIGKSIFEYVRDYSSTNECTENCNLKNGKCVSGICQCYDGFKSYDCNSLNNTNLENDNIDETKASINTNNNGSEAIIENGSIEYNILVTNLVEIDINGNKIKNYNLLNNWIFNRQLSNSSYFYFNQSLGSEDSSITTIMEIVNNDKIINFGDVDFSIDKNSIKITVYISQYKYSNTLNTLQLYYKSTTTQNIQNTNECNQNTNNININSLDLENSQSKGSINHQSFVTIENKNRILYGRFIDRVISNGRSTFATTSIIEKQNDSITIAMNLPHCDFCIIDPDFSALISPQFISNCGSKKNSYLIPIAVAIPVAGVAALSALSIYLYKRRIIQKEMNKISYKLQEMKQQSTK